MYGGRIVEMGQCADVIRNSSHPYTYGLLASRTGHAAVKGSRLATIPGSPPDLASLPPGCSFSPRCPRVIDACKQAVPQLLPTAAGHFAACIRAEPAPLRLTD
jgi:peptide/nickel transport system ATP-binding protein